MKYLILLIPFLAMSSFQYKNRFETIQSDTTISGPFPLNTICGYPDFEERHIIILNQTEYEKMKSSGKCPIDSFPSIDFSLYSLIHIRYDYSGCHQDINRNMECIIDHQTKTVRLGLILYENGVCRPLYYGMDWFLIPKIPEEYSIESRKAKVNTIGGFPRKSTNY